MGNQLQNMYNAYEDISPYSQTNVGYGGTDPINQSIIETDRLRRKQDAAVTASLLSGVDPRELGYGRGAHIQPSQPVVYELADVHPDDRYSGGGSYDFRDEFEQGYGDPGGY